jgi:hypothetical protein
VIKLVQLRRAAQYVLIFTWANTGPAVSQSLDAKVVAGPVCDVLKRVVPATRGFKPEGARAQLVTAVAEKFDYDGAKLRQVRAHMDEAAKSACPKEREAMLSVTKTKTLAEAVD